MEISFFGFSASRNSSCATISVDMPSSTGPGHEDDPLLQQPREDVVGALAAGGLLDHHGNEVHVGRDRVSSSHPAFGCPGSSGLRALVDVRNNHPAEPPQGLPGQMVRSADRAPRGACAGIPKTVMAAFHMGSIRDPYAENVAFPLPCARSASRFHAWRSRPVGVNALFALRRDTRRVPPDRPAAVIRNRRRARPQPAVPSPLPRRDRAPRPRRPPPGAPLPRRLAAAIGQLRRRVRLAPHALVSPAS